MTTTFPLPARPTTYKGIKMRSRLEARYAALCDRAVDAGRFVAWQYEPMCFAGQGGQYLPDFALDLAADGGLKRIYVEVKPVIDDDALLRRRMEIPWESEPEAGLTLTEMHGQHRGWHGVDGAWRLLRSDEKTDLEDA